jgi:hypothetical protein
LFLPRTVPRPTPFVEAARLAADLRGERVLALSSVEVPKAVSPPIAADRVDGSDLVLAANGKLEYRAAENSAGLVLTRAEPGYRLCISPVFGRRPEIDAFRQLFRLSPGRLEYDVRRVDVPGGVEPLPLPDSLDSLNVRTRTLLDMLTFLAKGVRVPEEHLYRGLAAQTVGPDGIVFDWTTVTSGLFEVSVQKKRPKDAAVAIEYQGYWYYIHAADKRSKSTLALIQALFNLQLSEPKKGGPLLTLPVGL